MDALLSLPPRLAQYLSEPTRFAAWTERLRVAPLDRFHFSHDPSGRRLGSGGGTVHLLHSAWKTQTAGQVPVARWLAECPRLILHAGGESRRLPAYATLGKAFMPLPWLPGLAAQRHDQMVADFQLPRYADALGRAAAAGSAATPAQSTRSGPGSAAATTTASPAAAPAGPRVLVTSGDVWLDFDPADIPGVTADIVGLGMRVPAEVAQHFGVFFIARGPRSSGGEQPVAFFLQKPTPAEIQRHTSTHDFYVDTGMWLLSAAAVECLFRICGWDEKKRRFATEDGLAASLDLYTEIGTALGAKTIPPALAAAGFGALRCATVPLERARFLHFGSNRQLLDAAGQLGSHPMEPARRFITATAPATITTPSPAPVWVDACTPDAPVRLAGHNLLTSVPTKARLTHLPPEIGVECAPLHGGRWALRVYHLDDSLRGKPSAGARICGQPATAWLGARQLDLPDDDVFYLPVYPVVSAAGLTQALIDWMTAPSDRPVPPPPGVTTFVSAAQLPDLVDFDALFAQRRAGQTAAFLAGLTPEAGTPPAEAFFAQDFAAFATFAAGSPALARRARSAAQALAPRLGSVTAQTRLAVFASRLTPGRAAAEQTKAGAFTGLRSAIIAATQVERASPRHALKDDQIVWARSPVRLDLAGGWTDTPPYCFDHGGAVVNVAVTLNGQPPIQVFARRLAEPVLRVRSIDLGVDETITDFAQLGGYTDPRSGFSLPKAALAMAGLAPDFYAGTAPRSLRAHLGALGGGLELSLLCAVPKGSGLGTSSILGSTLLGAVARALGLGWDLVGIYRRVLAMEQLLTTGGGWQDQAGALFPSLKLVATSPGLEQSPTVRYLPEREVAGAFARGEWLLYYTGLTRLAKGILQEIVQAMFLGDRRTLLTLGDIHANAFALHQHLQRGELAAATSCVARSWTLNQRLDPGTNPPVVQAILDACGHDLAACKLLGAGGGGYLLLCARDLAAAARLRHRLEAQPPNPRARFVDCAVSTDGLQVTVS